MSRDLQSNHQEYHSINHDSEEISVLNSEEGLLFRGPKG